MRSTTKVAKGHGSTTRAIARASLIVTRERLRGTTGPRQPMPQEPARIIGAGPRQDGRTWPVEGLISSGAARTPASGVGSRAETGREQATSAAVSHRDAAVPLRAGAGAAIPGASATGAGPAGRACRLPVAEADHVAAASAEAVVPAAAEVAVGAVVAEAGGSWLRLLCILLLREGYVDRRLYEGGRNHDPVE